MDDAQLLRYSRHIMLEGWDIEGQEQVNAARVLVVGAGGLGSAAALYLAAAGVGELVIADDDVVELNNLQRQIAHTTDRIGELKVDSAQRAIAELNPLVRVHTIPQRLQATAMEEAVGQVDLVVDAADNYATRFAINRAAVHARVPLVSAAAIRTEGQVAVFDSRRADSPCYQCLYREVPEENLSCAQSGVLAPLVGVIGSLQAVEALKVLVGLGRPLVGRLLILDALTMDVRVLQLGRRPDCPVCFSASGQL